MRHVLCGHLWGCHFHGGGVGGWGGGVAALQAFNQDALTNRSRISLLDKASFILMLHIEQDSRRRWNRGRAIFFFFQGHGGGQMAYCTSVCFVWSCLSPLHVHTQTHTYSEAEYFFFPYFSNRRWRCIFLRAVTYCDYARTPTVRNPKARPFWLNNSTIVPNLALVFISVPPPLTKIEFSTPWIVCLSVFVRELWICILLHVNEARRHRWSSEAKIGPDAAQTPLLCI